MIDGEIVSERRYPFRVEPATLWETFGAVDRFRHWWPWLRSLDARGLHAGDVWRCVVRPPLPYAVRFAVHLDEVTAPRHVRATVSGQVQGTATLDVEATPAGCTVRLHCRLAPASRALRLAAAVTPAVARFGHDWILDAGARQFAARAV